MKKPFDLGPVDEIIELTDPKGIYKCVCTYCERNIDPESSF